MPKRKEEKITPEGIRKAMVVEQDKINAALAGAVISPDGSRPLAKLQPQVEVKPESKPIEDVVEREPVAAPEQEPPKCEDTEFDKQENTSETSPSQIAMSTEDFGRKCFNLDINSEMCHYQSRKNPDKSIVEFLRGINKKIYDETRNGGFSANIQFRVAPNDYVNVNHIIDWYKARGFHILNNNMSTSPYGQHAGMIEHSFTISWAEV